jgi:hypothetical protein
MRGLDPRIHHLRKTLSKRMDCRVKPGNDESMVHQHIVYDCGEPAIFSRENSLRAKKSSVIINLKN